MNPTFLNVVRIGFALFCIGFGLDKFLYFLPTCSLTQYISPTGMLITGIIELVFGMALLFKKYELMALRILTALIIGGLMLHLIKGTTDFNGAIVGSLMGLFLIFAYKRQIKGSN